MSILSKAKAAVKKVASSVKNYITGGNKTASVMDFPVTKAPVIKNTQVQKDLTFASQQPATAKYFPSNTTITPGSNISISKQYATPTSSAPENVSSLSRSGVSSNKSVVSSTITSPATTTAATAPTTVTPIGNLGQTSPTLPSAPSAGLSLPTAASNLMNVGATDASGAPIVADPVANQGEDKYQKMMEDAIGGLTDNKPGRTDNGRAAALESSGYNQALKEANDISNQISAINADTESKKLSLIGQGRGIPEAIIGGQQAKLDREAAIKTMPLTAQYKAAVGLVDAAKEIVNNFVADERAYQSSLQQWQNNVYQATYQYASAQQKKEIDAQNALTNRQYEVEDQFLEEKRKIMNEAIDQGKGYLLTRMTNAKSYAELDSVASEMGASIDTLYKQAQIAEMNAPSLGAVTLTGKPQNASQSAANGYADRLNESNIVIDSIGGKFTGNLAFGGSLPNALQSGERQSYEQAKRNFITAVLRRESGAAISPSEFETEALKYFPQAGDKAETVIQKSNARNTAINNVYREANVARPVLPGMIVESDGKKYRVSSDGETLEEI